MAEISYPGLAVAVAVFCGIEAVSPNDSRYARLIYTLAAAVCSYGAMVLHVH